MSRRWDMTGSVLDHSTRHYEQPEENVMLVVHGVRRRPMLRPAQLTVLLIIMFLAAKGPQAAAAGGAPQGGIQVVDAPAPVYDFGSNIHFHLTAHSTATIITATLFINTGGLTPALRHSNAIST